MMLSLGSCAMAMHMNMERPQVQAYLSGPAVRMRPPTCVEAYTEFPSEDFYQSPSEDDQTSGRPLARQWPSARKMGSKMSQKLQQHHHEEGPESLEPEPTSPGWSYHDATPAEAGGGLLSLAAKRKIFWASQLRTPKVLEDTSSNRAKRPSSPSVEEAIAWKVKEALTLSTIARGLDHRARQASDSSGACMCAWRAKLAYSLPTTHAHHKTCRRRRTPRQSSARRSPPPWLPPRRRRQLPPRHRVRWWRRRRRRPHSA